MADRGSTAFSCVYGKLTRATRSTMPAITAILIQTRPRGECARGRLVALPGRLPVPVGASRSVISSSVPSLGACSGSGVFNEHLLNEKCSQCAYNVQTQ